MESYRVTAFGQPLERQAEATPEPKDREVLVRITGGGVCHSDEHHPDDLQPSEHGYTTTQT